MDEFEVDVQGLYQNRAKRKRRTQITRTTQQQAEIDDLDLQWQQPRLEHLDTALRSGPPNHQPHNPPDIAELVGLDPGIDRGADQPPAAGPPNNFAQYVRGDDYQARRIREYQQWDENLPSMFIAYMQCADLTSEWGDESKWNTDWKLCRCGDCDMKEERAVDCFDVMSESIILSSRYCRVERTLM